MTPAVLQRRRRSTHDTARVATRTVAPERADPRAIAIEAIIREASCTHDEAEAMLVWLNRVIMIARGHKYDPVHLVNEEMAGHEYDIFDVVIPHDSTAISGSAHAAINTALLDASKDEYTIWHYQTVVGRRHYCNVAVGIQSV